MTDNRDQTSELLSYATEVASTDDIDTVFAAMTDAADAVFDFSSAVVETADKGVLSVRTWSGRPPSVDGIPADEGVAGRTFQTGESQLVDDVLDDPRVGHVPDGAPRSVISVPIGDIGVFQAGNDEPDGFDEDDVELAELLASHCYQAVERIESQQAVRESGARFRKLFEQADDALVLYDVLSTGETVIRLANDAASSLLDTPEAELHGDSLSAYLDAAPEAFHPADENRSFETSLSDDDGRIFLVKVKPFLREDGPDGFAVVIDVTEQHYRERALTELHEATRAMLTREDPTGIANVVVDTADELLDLPYVAVFFAAADADELRPAAFVDPRENQNPPVLRAGQSLAWEAFETGEMMTFDDASTHHRVRDPDTNLRDAVVHPLGDHGVLVVGAPDAGVLDPIDLDLVGVLATNAEAALDRTEHVRQLETRESELRRERNRLAALFENVPSPTASFVVENGNPIIRSINPAFEAVFGYDEAELVGENVDDYIVPPERETEAQLYNEKLVNGQNINVEVRRLTTDGPRDFLLDVVPFRLDEPNIHGYAMYTDITARKERERELERQNDRLEEFASIVSHDLRNPLNVARGYLELAEQTGDDQYFHRTNEALERMHDIIESVLALARHGRSLDDTREVSLADAAKRAWRNVDTDTATLHVADDATLHADPSRFGSLLENLFANAIQHGSEDSTSSAPGETLDFESLDGEDLPRSIAPDGDGDGSTSRDGDVDSPASRDAESDNEDPINITVGTLDPSSSGDDAGDDSIEGFYVEDDGVGIPSDKRDLVFEYGETRNDEGTGFGLAIVKSVAEAHGWTPNISESDAGGARFEFRTT
jgi:PAS domain S-box-containing protein